MGVMFTNLSNELGHHLVAISEVGTFWIVLVKTSPLDWDIILPGRSQEDPTIPGYGFRPAGVFYCVSLLSAWWSEILCK